MVAKAREELQRSHRARQDLLEKLAEHEAQALLFAGGSAVAPGHPRVVVQVLAEADAAYLRLLAAKLVAQPGVQALLGTHAGGHVVFAQSAGLAAEMNALLRETLAAVGGKGGGTKEFAQGSVPDPTLLDAILTRARERLRSSQNAH